jgi:hypothetical protein
MNDPGNPEMKGNPSQMQKKNFDARTISVIIVERRIIWQINVEQRKQPKDANDKDLAPKQSELQPSKMKTLNLRKKNPFLLLH